MSSDYNPAAVGQAINLAWQYALFSGAVTSPEDAAALAREVYPIVRELAESIQDAERNPVDNVIHAFPGAQVVQEGPAAYIPQQPAFTNPQSQPAPVPGATDGDPQTAALWQELLQDREAWWDNRINKRNPKAPDFKHKKDGDKALWIVGKKNPSWVTPAFLASRGF